MSKRATGNVFEKWCESWILKNVPGSVVHRQVSVASRIKVGAREIWVSKRNDIFGCIDLIAISPHIKPTFIQCTCDSSIGRKFKELVAIPWSLRHSDVNVWQKMAGRRVVVWSLNETRTFEKFSEIRKGKLTTDFPEGNLRQPIPPQPRFSDDSIAVLSDIVGQLQKRLSRKRPAEDPSPL